MTELRQRLRRSDRWRIGVIVALCLALAVPVVVALAASPAPGSTGGTPPTTPTTPTTSAKPDGTGRGDDGPHLGYGQGLGLGKGGLRLGGSSFGAVTIAAIQGSTLSLKTDDGWTRTIAVVATTKIQKAGQPAKLTDLKVGDKIRFTQKRNDDGTFAIVAIEIPTQAAAGVVTVVGSDSVTIKGRGGKTQVIKLAAGTVFKLGGADAAKGSLKVGSRIAVQGDASGGAITAIVVRIQLDDVVGTVTGKTTTTITVKTRDGKSAVIHLASTTKFRVRGKKDATVADVAIGDIVIATGVARSDGSLDARSVGAGKPFKAKPLTPAKPGASPQASPQAG